MTRLVVDENLSPRLAQGLRDRGHDAVHVNEVGLRSAPDPVIMAWAARERRAVVTQDHDFLDHLRDLGAVRPSVVKVVQRGPAALIGAGAQTDRLAHLLPSLDRRLARGAAVTVGRSVWADRALPLALDRGRDR